MKKTKKRNVLLLVMVLLTLICGTIIYINSSLTPMPENKRNITATDISMFMDFPDKANRAPIVRTYTKEEFDSFKVAKMDKLRRLTSGNIEGDIPALVLDDGIGVIRFSFERIDEQDIVSRGKIVTDEMPNIRIETLYSQEEPVVIDDILMASEETGIYLYEVKSRLKQDKTYHHENDSFIMEGLFIKVQYSIDGKEYVSITAINTIEYK